eukprot:s3266_g13.t1
MRRADEGGEDASARLPAAIGGGAGPMDIDAPESRAGTAASSTTGRAARSSFPPISAGQSQLGDAGGIPAPMGHGGPLPESAVRRADLRDRAQHDRRVSAAQASHAPGRRQSGVQDHTHS